MHESQVDLLNQVYQARAPLLDEINKTAPWHAIHRERTMFRLTELIHPSSKVLDLACGTGILARRYLPLASYVVLVDLLPCMLDLAKSNLASLCQNSTVSFVQAELANLPASVTEHKYDLILMTQALNFLDDPATVFEIASECLAPKGCLYVDMDTAYRWIVIEALSGHLANATTIALEAQDRAKNIVGTNYYFHKVDTLVGTAASYGLRLVRNAGICHVSSLIHIFNQSSDFLLEEVLEEKAKPFLDRNILNRLLELDAMVEHLFPPEAAGWQVLEFSLHD